MTTKYVEVNQTYYEFWVAATKEKHGSNMLDWPKWIREAHNKFKIVEPRVHVHSRVVIRG